MGRKLLNKETYLQPAEYAEGHMSLHICYTLDADAGDPASLLAASLAAARLMHEWGRFRCTAFCDPETRHVRLTLDADFREADECQWSDGLCEAMEDLWEDDGGVEDYGRALSLVKEDALNQLANWIQEKSEELGMDLVLRADVSVHDFRIWQK